MSGTYKGVGRRGLGGGVSGGRGWTAGGGPYPLLGLFELAMSPRSASYIGPNMHRGPVTGTILF